MRSLSVRQRRLPGIGELLELDTRSRQTVTVVFALAGLLTGARVYLTPEAAHGAGAGPPRQG
jgi:hypothetical protein